MKENNQIERERGIQVNPYLLGLLQRLIIFKVKGLSYYSIDAYITDGEREKLIDESKIEISDGVLKKILIFKGKSNNEKYDERTLDKLCKFLTGIFQYTSWENFVSKETTDFSRKLPTITLSALKETQPNKFKDTCDKIHERVNQLIKNHVLIQEATHKETITPMQTPQNQILTEEDKTPIFALNLQSVHQTKKDINWFFEHLESKLDIFSLLPHTVATFGSIVEGYNLVDLANKSIKQGIDDDMNHLRFLTKMTHYFLIERQKDKRDIFGKYYYSNPQRLEKVLYDFDENERNIVHSYGIRKLSNRASIEISNANFGKKHLWTLEQMSINMGTQIFKKGYSELYNSEEIHKEIEQALILITEQDEQELKNTLSSIENKGFKFIAKRIFSPLKSHTHYYKGFICFLYYEISKKELYLEQAIEALETSKILFLSNKVDIAYRNMSYCADLLLFMCYRENNLQKAEPYRLSAFNFFKFYPKMFKFKFGVYSSRFAMTLGLPF